ncbi:MAG: AmmeMemoRadiSam system protein A [Polyangia bacterium]|jgi:AmmeMemoRadiSam system protein A|nr:AmmeMemoRadiSam system protein A [Polyangia bacterium]
MKPLEEEDREELLGLARASLRGYLRSGRRPADPPRSERLREPAGAFVTLKTGRGGLRGCIGTFSAASPLFQAVSEMAVAAGTRDPRFPPVTLEELDGLHMEISVLSPREVLRDPSAVEVGVHGLCISLGYHHGVLLPQVPVEQGWDRETFLAHLSMKAGLPADAWKDPEARLETFTAQVFGEAESRES